MAKEADNFPYQNKVLVFSVVAMVTLVVLACFLLSQYFFKFKTHGFKISNSYYSFTIKTPANWMAEENAVFSESAMRDAIAECRNHGTALDYQIGAFRFKDHKYPVNFGDGGKFQEGFPSGGILAISVYCMPGGEVNLNSGLKVAGENAVGEILNVPGFGKVSYFSFSHEGLQYRISEYVYVEAGAKSREKSIRDRYENEFNNIVSSMIFK